MLTPVLDIKLFIIMRLSISVLALLPLLSYALPTASVLETTTTLETANVLQAGGPQECRQHRDGTGRGDYQVTKDCCHHVHQDRGQNNVYFNEAEKRCHIRASQILWIHAVKRFCSWGQGVCWEMRLSTQRRVCK